MEATLCVESTLEHDGDGLAHFAVTLTNGAFSARIVTWGQETDHLQLASTLQNLPVAQEAKAAHTFGKTGTCELELSCLDSLGHICIWASFTADWPVGNLDRHETACLFMRSDSAALDTFVSQLQGFIAGTHNRACLSGLGP